MFFMTKYSALCVNFQVIEKRFGELITHIDEDKTDEDIFHKISKKKVNPVSKRKSMAAIQQLRRRRKTSQVCRLTYQTNYTFSDCCYVTVRIRVFLKFVIF